MKTWLIFFLEVERKLETIGSTHPKLGLPVIFSPYEVPICQCQDFDGEPQTQARGQGLLLPICFPFWVLKYFSNGKHLPVGSHTKRIKQK